MKIKDLINSLSRYAEDSDVIIGEDVKCTKIKVKNHILPNGKSIIMLSSDVVKEYEILNMVQGIKEYCDSIHCEDCVLLDFSEDCILHSTFPNAWNTESIQDNIAELTED